MKQQALRSLLIALCCILSAVLLAALGIAVHLTQQRLTPAPTEPAVTTQPTQIPAQTTAPAETTAPTTQPTTAPVETTAPTEATEATEAATVPTETEPTEPNRFVLTFVGDCTLADVQEKSYFADTVGSDYLYPMEYVRHIFTADDYTFANLECALTTATKAQDKRYAFKGKPEYTRIFTENGIEFANVVNNHAFDYGRTGYNHTLEALDSAGLAYVERKKTGIFTTESGLVIGVYTDNFPTGTEGIAKNIASLKDQGAQVIVAVYHWGTEYYYQPDKLTQKIAHATIDAGADIVYGHHPHVLQNIEEYNDGVIFYSLGNFCFGGNANPPDKDTAILQQEILRTEDGRYILGQLTRIPCYVTSLLTWGNDFRPMPMEPGTEAYDRVLRKLAGTYEKKFLQVSYRDDLFPEETEPSTEPSETVPETQPTEPSETTPETQPTEPSTEATQPPAEPPAEPTEPPTQATEPPTDPTGPA